MNTAVGIAERSVTLDQQKRLDTLLNKTFLDLTVYSIAGYTLGIGLSIFFKQKSLIRNFGAGIGGSYGFALNKNKLNLLKWNDSLYLIEFYQLFLSYFTCLRVRL